MAAMRAFAPLAGLSAALALVAAGCGGGASVDASRAAAASKQAESTQARCAHPAGWQRLANRIAADVYCPGWLPDPLTSQIGGRWNNIDSVSRDRSYLESFVWQETELGPNGAGGELHVNLRGYPGATASTPRSSPSTRAQTSGTSRSRGTTEARSTRSRSISLRRSTTRGCCGT